MSKIIRTLLVVFVVGLVALAASSASAQDELELPFSHGPIANSLGLLPEFGDGTAADLEVLSAADLEKWLASETVLTSQDPAEKPPIPAHTGIKALVFETASDFVMFPQRKSTWIILAIGGAAALAVHPADGDVNAKLSGSDAADNFFAAGKYLGGATQAAAAVTLYLVGRYVLPHTKDEPRTNKVSHLGFDMLRALILSQAVVQGIKLTVRRDRPTGECCSFPSGHAASTFATAAVLERHLGYRASWPMFLIATYVATSRLHDNRHFLSDVVFGSSVGIASGWTVVGRHGRSSYALVPVAVPGGIMMTLSRR